MKVKLTDNRVTFSPSPLLTARNRTDGEVIIEADSENRGDDQGQVKLEFETKRPKVKEIFLNAPKSFTLLPGESFVLHLRSNIKRRLEKVCFKTTPPRADVVHEDMHVEC